MLWLLSFLRRWFCCCWFNASCCTRCLWVCFGWFLFYYVVLGVLNLLLQVSRWGRARELIASAYILKPSSNWSLFKLIISDETLIKSKSFLPIYVHFNGQTFSSVFEQFSFTSNFFGLKMQKSNFCKKKWFWEWVFFYKIDVYVVTNWSVRLVKTPNNWNFAFGGF